jgi:hypothetical protein
MSNDNSRLGKEYKISHNDDNFKIIFGTVNRLNPIVVYLKINFWVKHNGEHKEYSQNINSLNSSIKNKIRTEIRNSKNFKDTFFYTPNIKKVISNNKENPFHISLEITLKQKDPALLDIKLLNEKLESLSKNIIDSVKSNSVIEVVNKK